MSARKTLTPQMLQYDDFDNRAETRWLSYLMFFHRTDYQSEIVNTDSLGFRISHGRDEHASAGGRLPERPVRLLSGSSTAMGIGANSDEATLSSRLWTSHAPSMPWLNFGGRSHSSAQELLLYLFYGHLLPPVREIVIFSGLNNLALSRLPASQRGDNGAFFNCGDFFEQMDKLKVQLRKPKLGLGRSRTTRPDPEEPVRPLGVRIADSAAITGRHLASWQLLAQATDAKITFVLQPLATWVRQNPAPQEKQLFGELDEISNFWQLFGDIATKEAGRQYAEALRRECEKLDISFLDINPVLADAVSEKNWLFVDRAHLTDEGTDIVAGILAEELDLS